MTERDRERIELLATDIMGWTLDGAPNPNKWWFDKAGRAMASRTGWNPLTNAADSKALRDRLRPDFAVCELSITRAGFIFALYRTMTEKLEGKPATFHASSTDEFHAVALCASRLAKGRT